MANRPRLAWIAATCLLGCMLVPARADNCENATTQADLDQCAGKAFKKADATLNSTYRKVLDRLGERRTKASLISAQQAWLAYRDKECDFETSSSVGGSVHGMAVTQCRSDLTGARSKRLNGLLTCAEGDLTCPVPPR